MEKLLFSEEQRFTQWWLWLIMCFTLLAVIIPISISVQQEWVLGLSFSEQPSPVTETVIAGLVTLVVMLGIFALIFTFRLKTKITTKGISVLFQPVHRKWKQITPDSIEHYEIRNYRANLEYGGHGARRRGKSGHAFTISGKTGLQLQLKNGQKILIGTQKKQSIEYAMRKLMRGEE